MGGSVAKLVVSMNEIDDEAMLAVKGMEFLIGRLWELAERDKAKIVNVTWQFQAGGNAYELTIEGQGKRKLIRIFGRGELARSVDDVAVREELDARLSKMLEFFRGVRK